MVKIRVRVWV